MAGVVVLAVLGLTAGCGSGPLSVPAYDVPAAQQATCARVLRDLPATLGGHRKRTVTGSAYAAAWGDPAIVLRCGVPLPTGYGRASACQTVSGIDWYTPLSAFDHPGDDATLTLVHRSVVVSVTVPGRDRPPDAILVDLGTVMRKDTAARGHCQ